MAHRNVLAGVTALALTLAATGNFAAQTKKPAAAPGAAGRQAPAFQVDPLWPKPLPNSWILGSITGVSVDSKDRIWLVHRGAASLNARQEMGLATDPPGSEYCCRPAPPVLEFDPAGTLVSQWGGPGEGYDWPRSPGGITVDTAGNVWIAAAGSVDTPAGGRGRAGAAAAPTPPPVPRPQDAHVLKFTRAGKFLLQIGKPGQMGGSDSRTALNRPMAVAVDVPAKEVYVADGFVNRRIVVFDTATGAYKRHWGAYGGKPEDADIGPYDPSAPPSKQFRTVSCVKISRDGLVYVCDRQNNRIQVFRKDGTFVSETIVSKMTRGDGAVWDVAFSHDPKQQFLYVADGQDQKVFVLGRLSLQVVSDFGRGGRYPGHFFGVGSIAVDSKGTVYTGENLEGKRLQRFVSKGRDRSGASGEARAERRALGGVQGAPPFKKRGSR